MANWKYNPGNYNEDGFSLIPAGDYRVRIDTAEETESRSGKDMIKLTLSVSGQNTKLWFYLVFDNSSEQAIQNTDQRLGSIFNSFNIEPGNLNTYDWEGKTGGARIRQRTDPNGNLRSEVHFFLPRKKVDELPAWIEGKGAPGSGQTAKPAADDFGSGNGASIGTVPF